MWYKEWTITRYKFWLWLVFYAFFAVMLTFVFSPYHFGNNLRNPVVLAKYLLQNQDLRSFPAPLFGDWIAINLLVTGFAAILGGSDIVAEEVDRGTLGFLLTRSIPRKQIYDIKLAINVVALTLANVLVSAYVLLADQTDLHPFNFFEAVGATGLVILVGIGVICISAAVSTLCHNVIHSILLTVGVLAGLGGLISVAVLLFSVVANLYIRAVYPIDTVIVTPEVMKWWSFIVNLTTFGLPTLALLVLIASCYRLGLTFFTRKQF